MNITIFKNLKFVPHSPKKIIAKFTKKIFHFKFIFFILSCSD